MYGREVGGRELTFGVSGALWKNVLIMYDRETGTLWSHLTAEGLVGPLKGKKLTTLPSLMTTWEEWKRLYPDSRVLDKTKGSRRGSFGRPYARDPYEGYYYSPDAGVLPEKYRDGRLHPKTFVLGLRAGGKAKAYPFPRLEKEGVVNDRLAGHPVVVAFEGRSRTGVVFIRLLEGRELRFERAGERSMRDRETGSTWGLLTGEATAGPLAGKRLVQVPTTNAFWFGWKDYYPATEVHGEGADPRK